MHCKNVAKNSRTMRHVTIHDLVWITHLNCFVSLTEQYQNQSLSQLTLTSRGTSTFASDCFNPLPTCQIMASGICFLNGHEPEHISYQTVLKKNQQQIMSAQNLLLHFFSCRSLLALRTCFPALFPPPVTSNTPHLFSRAFSLLDIFPRSPSVTSSCTWSDWFISVFVRCSLCDYWFCDLLQFYRHQGGSEV